MRVYCFAREHIMRGSRPGRLPLEKKRKQKKTKTFDMMIWD